MAQEAELSRQDTDLQPETHERKPDESATGRDMPGGDGTVGDEQTRTDDDRGDRAGGQDHSTEGHERTEPTSGVGSVQSSDETGWDIASISE